MKEDGDLLKTIQETQLFLLANYIKATIMRCEIRSEEHIFGSLINIPLVPRIKKLEVFHFYIKEAILGDFTARGNAGVTS